MSIHPKYQELLLAPDVPRDPHRIDIPVDAQVTSRLEKMPEFVKAYEPDGMKPEDFITFGVCQRTLTQFDLAGWAKLENFKI